MAEKPSRTKLPNRRVVVRRRAAAMGLCLLAAASGVALLAQAPESTAERWWRELGAMHGLLVAGRAEAAYEPSRRLVGELVASLKPGGRAVELASVALAQLALAEAGRSAAGSAETGAWHLEVAAILNPAFRQAGFEEFGELGERLRVARRRHEEGDPAEGHVLPTAPIPGLVPPTLRESPHMVFRASREVLEALDPGLRVTFVVDRQGSVRRPRVVGRLDNPAPILLSLDLLRAWRFEPARLGDRPVPVRYGLDLPLTEGVVRRAGWDLAEWRISSLLAGEELRAAREAAGRLLLEIESSPPSTSREIARRRVLDAITEVEKRLASGPQSPSQSQK